MKNTDEYFLKMVKELAEGGNAEAQCTVGDWYANAQYGYRQDHAEAVKWYRLAADQGDAMGQSKLAVCVALGRGIKCNQQKATALLLLVAKDPERMMVHRLLGLRALYGHGVPKDYSIARKWLSIAAKKDDALSLQGLGELYLGGHGVKKDSHKAAKFFQRACKIMLKGKGLDGLEED